MSSAMLEIKIVAEGVSDKRINMECFELDRWRVRWLT